MGMYRATAILSRVHTAPPNYNYFSKMTNMPDEILLAKIMTALHLEFERTLHYHYEDYDSDNYYGLLGPFMRQLNTGRVAPPLSSLLMINLQ